MTCKDCLHFDVCYIVEHYGADIHEEGAEHDCKQFKDRSRYVVREKGEWIGEGDGYADGEIVYDVWYCSECNHCIDDGTDDPAQLPNFCPNCGADMRKGETDEET